MVIDELVTLLKLNVSPDAKINIESFKAGLTSVRKGVLVVSAALTAAAVTVMHFAENMNETSADLERFSRMSGMSSSMLQEMGYAASQAGGSLQSIQSDLLALQSSMASPIPGRFNEGMFMLGIGLRDASGAVKTADQLFMDFVKRTEGMSALEKYQWGKEIGLSDDSISLASMGYAKIMEMREKARKIPVIVDEADLAKAREFNQSIVDLTSFMKYLGQTIAATAGPVLGELVDDFMAWVSANKEWIKLNLQKIVEGAAEGVRKFAKWLKEKYETLKKLLPDMKSFTESLMTVGNIAKVVAIAMGALLLSLIVMNWQFYAIATAVSVVIWAIQDFISWLNDGESTIGGFLEKMPELVKLLNAVGDAIKKLIGGNELDDKVSGWTLLFQKLGDAAFRAAEAMVWATNLTAALLSTKGSEAEYFKDIATAWNTTAPLSANKVYGGSEAEYFKGIATAPLSANKVYGGAGSSSSQTTNDNRNFNITVNSPDPAAAGRSVMDALGRYGGPMNMNTPGALAPAGH